MCATSCACVACRGLDLTNTDARLGCIRVTLAGSKLLLSQLQLRFQARHLVFMVPRGELGAQRPPRSVHPT